MTDSPQKDHDEVSADERPTWAKLHLWQMQPLRDALVVLIVVGAFWLGQKISVVTVPLLLAIFFAYLFEPVIRFLMGRTRLHRQGSVVAVMAATLLLILGPITLGLTFGVVQGVSLVSQISNNLGLVERYVDAESDEAVQSARAGLEAGGGDAWLWIGRQIRNGGEGDLAIVFDTVQSWVEVNAQTIAETAAGVGMNVVQLAYTFIIGTFGLMFMIFLTFFFFFFFSTQWVGFQHFTTKLVPEKNKETVYDLARKFDRVISGFVRGRITIAFLQSLVFTTGYFLIGVPAAFILGPIVAMLSIVPYLALVGLPISIILLWLENHAGFRGTWWWVLVAPTAFYFFAQALDDYVWTPLIQGKETGMSTPMILFASLAGGVLFGVFGLLIAIPIAACIKILIEEIFWPQFKAWAEGEAEDILPIRKG